MSASDMLQAGKLPAELLSRLLSTYVQSDPSVLIGPEVGADAAAIQVGERIIVVKSDPITFPTPDASNYLVNVNANDIVCMGAEPRWLLVTSLLPEGRTTATMVESQFQSLQQACLSLGVTLVGGHTEITVGLDRPIMVGLMIGETDPDSLLDLRRSQPGDAVLLFNGIAIEGTAILANEVEINDLGDISLEVLQRAREFTTDPGVSVVPAARALQRSGATIRGMHDPTEGGIATALHELSRISGLQVRLDGDEILIHDETHRICAALGLDPLGLIASGALLAVVAADSIEVLMRQLRDEGIRVARIGTLADLAAEQPGVIYTDGRPLEEFATDEIARFFAGRQHRETGASD